MPVVHVPGLPSAPAGARPGDWVNIEGEWYHPTPVNPTPWLMYIPPELLPEKPTPPPPQPKVPWPATYASIPEAAARKAFLLGMAATGARATASGLEAGDDGSLTSEGGTVLLPDPGPHDYQKFADAMAQFGLDPSAFQVQPYFETVTGGISGVVHYLPHGQTLIRSDHYREFHDTASLEQPGGAYITAAAIKSVVGEGNKS